MIDAQINAARIMEVRELVERDPSGPCSQDYLDGWNAAMQWVAVLVSPTWTPTRLTSTTRTLCDGRAALPSVLGANT